MSHSQCVDTSKTLLERKDGQTWRALAMTLGYSEQYAAVLHHVAHRRRRLPAAQENELRERLGLPPLPRKRYHRPCLDDAEYADFLAWREQRKATP